MGRIEKFEDEVSEIILDLKKATMRRRLEAVKKIVAAASANKIIEAQVLSEAITGAHMVDGVAAISSGLGQMRINACCKKHKEENEKEAWEKLKVQVAEKLKEIDQQIKKYESVDLRLIRDEDFVEEHDESQDYH